MNLFRLQQFAPIELEETEQVVLAVEGRVVPRLSDAIWIAIFAPTLFLLPLLALHHIFRPIAYLVTTERVLVVEPTGIVSRMNLKQIKKFRGTKSTLIIYGGNDRIVLSRLPDAWFFETVILKVIKKVQAQ